ncbi:FxsA family protein [Candidatus Pelagibacter sp.]|nr:FxsA family protein [Candidatus Pelagibacter sp.]
MNTALILILGIPLVEIYLFIKVGSQIGALNTILLIIITAVVGIWYARYEGFNTLRSGMSQLVKNELPLYEIVSGAAIAFAALLLILPGFATDVVGVLLVFPITRKIILSKYSKKYSSKRNNNVKEKNFIEGEYEDIEDKDGK